MRVFTEQAEITEQQVGGPPRSDGVHVSAVVRDLAIRSGVLKQSPEELDGGCRYNLRMAMGTGWERLLYHVHPESLWQPGEVSLDGLVGTVDGEGLDDRDEPVLEEVKLTWQTSRRDIQEDFLRLTQVKTYLRMKRMRRARLRIGYVNGDYRKSGPQYLIHHLEFSDLELQENWDMVYGHARRHFGL